jgi:(2Fe-2S) ferredoxin
VQRRFDIRVCRGPVCAGERAADAVHARLAEGIAARDLSAVVDLERQSCFGRCRLGPNVHVGERLAPALRAAAHPPRRLSAFYNHVEPDDADDILTAHVLAGRVVERLAYRSPLASLIEPAPDNASSGLLAPGRTVAAPAPEAEPAPEPEQKPTDTAAPACNDPEPHADDAADPR